MFSLLGPWPRASHPRYLALSLALSRFYRDALMLENFAIMNFAGFSKILKKHDKVGAHARVSAVGAACRYAVTHCTSPFALRCPR